MAITGKLRVMLLHCTLTIKSLIKITLQVYQKDLLKAQKWGRKWKRDLFHSHCSKQNNLEKFWALAETEAGRGGGGGNFKTISWNLFLFIYFFVFLPLKLIFKKLCFSLHLVWLAFLQIRQHPMQEETKVYWSLLLCNTELHRKFYCTFAAFNFPRLFNNSVLLWHKRQARNPRLHFSAPDRTWHYTLTASDNVACSLKAIRLHNDQDAGGKKSLWGHICKNVIPIIHWQVVITINND